MIDFRRHHQIYYLLSINKKPLSSSEIADYMRVSVRTIKDDMQKVAAFALDHGSLLHSKRGSGYWLEIVDQTLFSQTFFQLKIRNAYSNDLQRVANNFDSIDVMQYIISQESYFKIEEIAEIFYIPKNLVSEVIRSLKVLLNTYDLTYVTRPNYGNLIIGDEFKIRIAMLMLFDIHFHKVEMERSVESFYQFFESDQEELSKTRLVLLSTLRHYHYRIHDDYSQCLSRYLVLQKKRIAAGYTLTLSQAHKDILRKFHLPIRVARDIFDSLEWVNQRTYSEDDLLTLVMLILLWSDSSLSESMSQLYDPLEDELDHLVETYLTLVEKRFNCYNHGFDYLKPFLKKRLAPLLLHQKFGCSKFDIKGGNFVDQRKITPIGAFFIEMLSQVMMSEYQCEFSNYLLQKFALDVAIFIQRFPLFEPVNILISSVDGIGGTRYIEQSLRELYNPALFKEIRGIELYEGRAIPTQEFDYMILDSLDTMFYAYDWPVYSLHSNFSMQNLHHIMDELYQIAQEKKRQNSPFIQSIMFEEKIVLPSKLKSMINHKKHQHLTSSFSQTLYTFDETLPINSVVHYVASSKKQIQATQFKSMVRLNIQLQSFEELALFSQWINTIHS